FLEGRLDDLTAPQVQLEVDRVTLAFEGLPVDLGEDRALWEVQRSDGDRALRRARRRGAVAVIGQPFLGDYVRILLVNVGALVEGDQVLGCELAVDFVEQPCDSGGRLAGFGQ